MKEIEGEAGVGSPQIAPSFSTSPEWNTTWSDLRGPYRLSLSTPSNVRYGRKVPSMRPTPFSYRPARGLPILDM